ncbi:transcriptional regulator [Alcanivorax xiamenensis]|uniref:Transcriptional regulator n=1 Tax=Alcanivorax xiamenensis TaxID=1177156 RepID=A0ABQ6Y8V9_9GAMM|nr:transcriptional regulator [Alcanivorax xiamenensis]
MVRAVIDQIDNEMLERMHVAQKHATNPWEGLSQESVAGIEMALEPEIQRIMLLNGPAVPGDPSQCPNQTARLKWPGEQRSGPSTNLDAHLHNQNVGSVKRPHFIQEAGSECLPEGVPEGDRHIAERPRRFRAATVCPIFGNMACLRAIPALRRIVFSLIPGRDAIRRVPSHVMPAFRANKVEVGALHGMEDPAAAMMQFQTMGQQGVLQTVRPWLFIEDP